MTPQCQKLLNPIVNTGLFEAREMAGPGREEKSLGCHMMGVPSAKEECSSNVINRKRRRVGAPARRGDCVRRGSIVVRERWMGRRRQLEKRTRY